MAAPWPKLSAQQRQQAATAAQTIAVVHHIPSSS
jgi:hypothetical protein